MRYLLLLTVAAWSVSAVGATCPTMNPGVSVFIWYQNPSSTCTPWGGSCAAGESLTLTARSFNYDFACGPHTFIWNFGDGSTANGPNVTHTYDTPGSYTAQVTVTNPAQTVLLSQVVNIDACGTMRPDVNTSISFHDQSLVCTELSGDCLAGTPILFRAKAFAGYNFSCASHEFNWSFGDGATANGMEVTHAFGTAGIYTVTCSILGPSNASTLIATVHVAPTPPAPPPPLYCGPIVINPVTLPVASVGSKFDVTFRPSTGKGPYSIFIVNGTLPPGLTFWVDNVSGTPTAAGSYGFNVYVVDSRGCGSVIPYTVVVNPSRHRATHR